MNGLGGQWGVSKVNMVLNVHRNHKAYYGRASVKPQAVNLYYKLEVLHQTLCLIVDLGQESNTALQSTRLNFIILGVL